MSFIFGDSWDPYAAAADTINGYWDSGTTTGFTLEAGRFAGSQALQNASNTAWLTKASGSNDAVHHIVCAFRQSAAITGSTLGMYIQLLDGVTAQCSIVFRSDGAILLTSGGPAGTALATYTGAFPATATWYAFEFEVVVNSATGSFAVRKNGNPANDFTLGSLNTRVSANNYANKLTLGQNATVTSQLIDDLLWRSDASTVSWAGDLRAYTRMPASDASVVFSRSPATTSVATLAQTTTATVTAGNARYTTFAAPFDGTIGSATISMSVGYTGNLKCSLFASSGTAPTTVLGSATVLANPVTGSNTVTFSSPVPVTRGVSYWIGVVSDTTSGTYNAAFNGAGGFSTTPYASFPVASPSFTTSSSGPAGTVTVTLLSNFTVVADPQQDALTSYVYSSNPGDADFYGIASISGTPSNVIAVTTRAHAQKSDAGTRTAAVQIKSGGTTVASPTLTLTTSGWQWAWRTDTTDPATSAAWTAAAVNNLQIGPKVIA